MIQSAKHQNFLLRLDWSWTAGVVSDVVILMLPQDLGADLFATRQCTSMSRNRFCSTHRTLDKMMHRRAGVLTPRSALPRTSGKFSVLRWQCNQEECCTGLSCWLGQAKRESFCCVFYLVERKSGWRVQWLCVELVQSTHEWQNIWEHLGRLRYHTSHINTWWTYVFISNTRPIACAARLFLEFCGPSRESFCIARVAFALFEHAYMHTYTYQGTTTKKYLMKTSRWEVVPWLKRRSCCQMFNIGCKFNGCMNSCTYTPYRTER